MPSPADVWLRWTARILGLFVCLYLGLFALDAAGAADLLLHLTPALVVMAILAVAWRWPALGGAGFLALASLYAVTAWTRPTWVAAVSGPLVLVGALFLASRRSRVKTAPA